MEVDLCKKKMFGLLEVNVKDSSFEVQTQFRSSIMHPDYPSSVKTIYFYFAIFQDLLISKIIESIPEMRHSSGKSMHLRGPEGFPKFSGSHQWLGSTTWTHASTHVTWKIFCFTTSSLSDSGCLSSNKEQVFSCHPVAADLKLTTPTIPRVNVEKLFVGLLILQKLARRVGVAQIDVFQNKCFDAIWVISETCVCVLCLLCVCVQN